ncbi:endo-1,4-beta-xylanase [Solwaraspora sp. WMMD1047]|uniref:endo-1,4-beta-xylanase n=1 Tax=Solwaraspora sp. WMMD1047 TaxID=3016102 RepID=UPI00241647A1|nr:endo-1,4-beta-xylanase [Solwaraspora sp. WMMD1047]MDG4829342.1 endo-1,4-beta-xylanase [Solwaraspora sp. WMMD1047]
MRLGNRSTRTSRQLSTILTFCLVTLVGSAAVATPAQAQDAVLLSNDFESDSYAPWGPRGSVTLAIATEGHESANSLSVTGRTADWQGAATSATALFEPGTTYAISAWAKLPAGTEGSAGVHFTVEATPAAGGDNTYTWVGSNVATTADEWVRIGGEYTMPADLSAATLYVEAEGTTPYLLDDVSITGPETGPGGPEPGTVVIDTDFEDGLDGWGPRDSGSGAPTVELSDVAHDGAAAALVTDRFDQGSGLGRDVSTLFEAGVTYDVSAWLRFAEGQPADQIWLSLASTSGDSQSFSTLGQFDGITNSGWTQVTASFTMPAADSALLYFETAWQNGETGNTSDFLVDDITVQVPEPPVIEDLTPIHETTDFPVGVAIDSRETLGAPAQLLTRHFNHITPENHMKPEAWYDADGNFRRHEQATALMDFAQANGIGLYGHVLVWHSQTPAWFFQNEAGEPLGTSEADQQIMRDRLRTHIFAVAESLADDYGLFGSDTNPLNSWDVVNEVVSDSGEYADGLRRSEWYRILGENFIDLAFQYADEAFNDTYAVAGADPVTLFINDYNTEQSGKQARYKALVDRLLDRGVPIDGVGHQFHVSLATPVSTLEQALATFADLPLTQAVTELDVTTGTPVTQAKLIEQGYFLRDAFRIFRAYSEKLYVVTVWGLTDGRSWRSGNGAPLIFNDSLRAKPAYYGVVDGELPARLRTANVFAGDVALTRKNISALEWRKLPLNQIEDVAQFQLRWAPDHLTVYVTVADDTRARKDSVTFELGDQTYTVARNGTGDVRAVAANHDGGYALIAHLPLTDAALGDTLALDVRVSDHNGDTVGWNTPGVQGTLTLIEPLSYLEVVQARTAPEIDGAVDPAWAGANEVRTEKQVSGTGGAVATVRTLWRGQTLYVLAEVADPVVDVSGSDPWIQDSVEIYVDAGNFKNGSYRYDDTQIRINADNVVSFGTGDEGFQANRLESAAVRTDTGYTVEAAISLLEYGGLDTFHGLDFQVNDASEGARTSIRNWADPTGTGYQTTARWGVGRLVGPDQGNIAVTVRPTKWWESDAGGGYCATLFAKNKTDQPLDWYAYVELDGEITNAWGFERQAQDDGTYRVSGADWNRTLQPGANTVAVGYCADTPNQ